MKPSFLLRLALLFFVPAAFASSPEIDSAMEYRLPVQRLKIDFGKMDRAMDHNGYAHLAPGGGLLPGNLQWFDRIYAFQTLKKTVFVKTNLMVEGKFMDKFYSHHDGLLIHFRAAGTTFAAFFEGFRDEEEAGKILVTLKQGLAKVKPEKSASAWLRRELSSEAWAQETAVGHACEGEQGIAVDYTKSPTPQNTDFVSTMMKHGKNCMTNLGRGFLDATYGAAVSMVQGVSAAGEKLSNLKMEDLSPSKLWSGAVSQYHSFVNFTKGLGDMLMEAIPGFAQLPTDQKVQIACKAIGSVGTTAILAWISGGGATPMILRGLATAVEEVGSLAKSTTLLAKAQRLRMLADAKDLKVLTAKKTEEIVAKYQSQIDSKWREAETAGRNYQWFNSSTSGPRSQEELKSIVAYREKQEAAEKAMRELRAQREKEIKAAAQGLSEADRNSMLNYAARAGYVGLAACGAVRGVTTPTGGTADK